MRKLNVALLVGVLIAGGLADRASCQTGNFQLEPTGVQLKLVPGHSSTTGFLIKAGSSGVLRDRLLLTLADWEFSKLGSVEYKEPSTTKRSAAAWLSIQPTTLPMVPGEGKLVRITVRIPDDVAPGVYASAVLVTEIPPELSPGIPDWPGTPPRVYCAFTILITVLPQEVRR